MQRLKPESKKQIEQKHFVLSEQGCSADEPMTSDSRGKAKGLNLNQSPAHHRVQPPPAAREAVGLMSSHGSAVPGAIPAPTLRILSTGLISILEKWFVCSVRVELGTTARLSGSYMCDGGMRHPRSCTASSIESAYRRLYWI